ncbi:MAG: hypothetical protein GVY18_00540 [Bacteroidetes bacterium]|jgi:anti-sigma regulatory factor (Ser/Thr protein kinase)|nr:hypothetical protein [Bacteroidota bacterium]
MNEPRTTHHLRLPMRPRAELEAVALARQLMTEAGMDETAMADVQMALIEAIINAVEHSDAPTDRIDVHFDVTPTTFEVRVEDAGRGFDADAVPPADPIAKRRRGETRGWGLDIMRRVMDRVEVTSGAHGTSITMIKHR